MGWKVAKKKKEGSKTCERGSGVAEIIFNPKCRRCCCSDSPVVPAAPFTCFCREARKIKGFDQVVVEEQMANPQAGLCGADLIQ